MNLKTLGVCKKHLDEYITQKHANFWEDEIMKTPKRWRKVVEQNGTYVIEKYLQISKYYL